MRQFSVLFALGLFLFTACTHDKPSKVVAEKFLNAYSAGNFEEARQYATENTQRYVYLGGILAKSAKQQQATEYEILDCQEVGNKATVKYRLKGSDNSDVMYLVKKNNAWLVGIE